MYILIALQMHVRPLTVSCLAYGVATHRTTTGKIDGPVCYFTRDPI